MKTKQEIIDRAIQLDSKMHDIYASQSHAKISVEDLAEYLETKQWYVKENADALSILLNKLMFFILCISQLEKTLKWSPSHSYNPSAIPVNGKYFYITNFDIPLHLDFDGPELAVTLHERDVISAYFYTIHFICKHVEIYSDLIKNGNVNNLDIRVELCIDKCKKPNGTDLKFKSLGYIPLKDITVPQIVKQINAAIDLIDK